MQREGTYQRSVHIILCDSNGDLILCKRPKTKRVYPDLFTSTAGGRLEPGESYQEAANRELKEETGIETNLSDYGFFHVSNDSENTDHHLYVGYPTNKQLSSIIFDQNEIVETMHCGVNEIEDMCNHNNNIFAGSFKEAFNLLKSKRQVVFDFDHTIFNWYKFKNDLLEALANDLGINENQINKAKLLSEKKMAGRYNINKHMYELSILVGEQLENINIVVERLLKNGRSYLYTDAVIQLDRLSNNKDIILNLVTYGDRDNQELFINSTRVDQFFNCIFYVKTKKEKNYWFKRITHLSYKNPYLINDDPKEVINSITEVKKGSKNIIVSRQGSKYYDTKADAKYILMQDLNNLKIG